MADEKMILPAPADGFAWRSTAFGPALVCTALESIAPHVFTTRGWRLGSAADARHDERAWAEVAHALGATALSRLRQVHGARVATADGGALECPEADALIGTEHTRALAVQAADCVPLLIADGRTGAVAAVHAGWRGLAAGAPAAAISALARRFGVHPGDLVVAIGPSIGPCCYEVGLDVVTQFARADVDQDVLERWFRRELLHSDANPPMRPHPTDPDKRYLDLWSATVESVTAAGVPRARVWLSGICTASHPSAMCSFRRDGQSAGRIVAAIRPAEPAFA